MSTPQLAEVFPAGEFLADELDARGWTQAEFAEVLGRPAQVVSEIIAGKKEITRESATQIGTALGTSAEYWLNLQDTYLLWKQAQDPRERSELDRVRTRARLRDLAPISLLVKRGLIPSGDLDTQAAAVVHLLGMRDLDDTPSLRFAARRSNVADPVTVLQRTWVACVRNAAGRTPAAAYSLDAFGRLVRRLTAEARVPEHFAQFQSMFAEVGVRLVHVEAFPGAKLDGCAMLVDGGPVIGVSGRGRRLDKVLFTILHESAHVLLGHLGADGVALVDDLAATVPESGPGTRQESEADEYARELAIPGQLSALPTRPTAQWLHDESERLQVHPITLVGRLQADGLLSWRTSLVHAAPNVTEYLQEWGPDAN